MGRVPLFASGIDVVDQLYADGFGGRRGFDRCTTLEVSTLYELNASPRRTIEDTVLMLSNGLPGNLLEVAANVAADLVSELLETSTPSYPCTKQTRRFLSAPEVPSCCFSGKSIAISTFVSLLGSRFGFWSYSAARMRSMWPPYIMDR